MMLCKILLGIFYIALKRCMSESAKRNKKRIGMFWYLSDCEKSIKLV